MAEVFLFGAHQSIAENPKRDRQNYGTERPFEKRNHRRQFGARARSFGSAFFFAGDFICQNQRLIENQNPQTTYNLLDKFVQMKILFEEPGRQRNRTFTFKELLEILK